MKDKFPGFILIFIFVLVTKVLSGQQYPIKNYSMDEGLSHSNVYRIFQDRKGFLWFCTDYGLCSYNGRAFNSYENDSLLAGSILSISEDPAGLKLISSIREGLVILNDSASLRLALPGGKKLSRVLYAVSRNKKVWAISREFGLSLYEINDKEVRQVLMKTAEGSPVVFHKIVEIDSEVLFTTDHGIYILTENGIKPYLEKCINEIVHDIRRGMDGSYWVAVNNRVVQIKNNKIVRTCHLKPNQIVSTILCDRNENVWVGLYGEGMLLIKKEGMEDITEKLDIRSTLINDIREDNEGNVWIATYDAGVYKVSTLDVLDYSLSGEKKRSLLCYSLDNYKNETLLIGTMGGAFLWEKGKKKPVATLRSDEFVYFVKSYDDSIFIGTSLGFYLSRNNKISKLYQYAKKNLGAISICRDHRAKVWIGGYMGLFHLEGEEVVPDTVPALLKERRFTVIVEDRQHNMWFGTRRGLIKYDGRQFTEVKLPAPRETYQNVRDIKQDRYNRIWLATEGGLLCLQDGRWKVFTVADGLTHNKCNKIVEDKDNTLWIGTLRGLSYLDLGTFELRKYGAGIFPKEVISLYYDDKNTLFVGTADGLSSITMNRILADDFPPPLYITAVKTNEKLIRMPSYVSLKYNDSKLRIDYIGLDYNSTNTIEYRYKIKGIDGDWHYTKNTSLELPSLPSGDFTFNLYARKNNKAWGPGVELKIHVSTPFWKTWWFISGLVILLTGGIVKIVRTRQDIIHRKRTEELLKELNEKLERRAEELESTNKELEQFAYVASHDLQEPLRMITSFMAMLQNKYNDKLDKQALQYIHYATDGAERMRQIILDLLEYSKSGKFVEKKPVNLNDILKEVIDLNAGVIQEKHAALHWQDLPVVNGNAVALLQVFQNLISNALKYHKRNTVPTVNITVSEGKTHWKFGVADNGIGIDERYFEKIFVIFQRLHTKSEFSGTGIGLAICKKIVENHNGKIWLESEPGKGTVFYFTLQK